MGAYSWWDFCKDCWRAQWGPIIIALVSLVMLPTLLYFLTASEEARKEDLAIFQAGPTRTTPVRHISLAGGRMDILYRRPDNTLVGVGFYPTGVSDGGVLDKNLSGKVVEVESPSEIEWYGTDEVWTIDRVKQVRLNSAQLEATGSRLKP